MVCKPAGRENTVLSQLGFSMQHNLNVTENAYSMPPVRDENPRKMKSANVGNMQKREIHKTRRANSTSKEILDDDLKQTFGNEIQMAQECQEVPMTTNYTPNRKVFVKPNYLLVVEPTARELLSAFLVHAVAGPNQVLVFRYEYRTIRYSSLLFVLSFGIWLGTLVCDWELYSMVGNFTR